MAKTDLYQEVTNTIITALESGVSPWVCPWDHSFSLPFNFSTDAPYSGINVILLLMGMIENNYSRNAWLTYKQAQALGGQVIKGSKSVRCIFYKPIEIEDKNNEEKKVIPMVKGFSLFNVDQIEGIECDELEKNQVFSPIKAAEVLMVASGAEIKEGGPKAYFSPSKDIIVLPDRYRFEKAEDFYATATHELIHWTGHKTRLDRNISQLRASCAFEELVAEIGSAFVNAELGLQGDLQHANYLHYWLDIMKADKRAIFTAASMASKAHRYLMQLAEKTQNIEKQDVAA